MKLLSYSFSLALAVLFISALTIVTVKAASLLTDAEDGVQRFDGFKVFRVRATKINQYKLLYDLSNNESPIHLDLDFWSEPEFNDFTDIMVGPSQVEAFLQLLEKYEIEYIVHIEDVQRIINQQGLEMNRDSTRNMTWDNYQTLETVFNWLDSLSAQYPNLVTLETFGSSTEGRPLRIIKISTGPGNKIGFWIDATIHAREWIACATSTYIINQLVTNSTAYADLLSVIDFYIVPVLNPDGYSYSSTTNRLWRKTRSDHDSPLGCRGVDANRNFGYGFGGPGSSNDKCSETYRGPYNYSEPEAEAMKNYINVLNSTVNWQTYITLHSYSQLWMTPWGYTTDLPSDYVELKRVADLAVAALTAVHGTRYTVGSSANVLYQSSGSSRDWAKGEGGFKYVYTLELRDTGNYGFLLPAAQIIPNSEETWAGLQVVARNYLSK